MTRRPTVQPPKPWAFPTGHVLDLANGLQVRLHHLPGQHVVSAGLVLDVPLSEEPSEREGVASVLADTLTEGTRSHPGTAFADAVEDCGAALESDTGFSHLHVLVDVPGSRLRPALELLAEAVMEPELSDADVDRQRTILLSDLDQRLATGAGMANAALRRALVAPESRASRPPNGTRTSLPTVTGEDVRAHHRVHVGPRNACLVVSGDFASSAASMVVELFGGWTNPDQPTPAHEVPQGQPRTALLVDRPGAVQADLRWGWFGIDRRDERWADLQVGVHALGGAYLSRLNRVLREEKGYSYGVGLANAPLRHGGLIWVQGSFRNDVVGDTLQLMPDLIDTLGEPLSQDEVTRAQDYLIGTSPLRYATASGVTHGVMGLLAAGLGPEHVDANLRALREVTPASASWATSQLVDPGSGTLVVVGDAGALEDAIRAAGWDPQVVSGDDLL